MRWQKEHRQFSKATRWLNRGLLTPLLIHCHPPVSKLGTRGNSPRVGVIRIASRSFAKRSEISRRTRWISSISLIAKQLLWCTIGTYCDNYKLVLGSFKIPPTMCQELPNWGRRQQPHQCILTLQAGTWFVQDSTNDVSRVAVQLQRRCSQASREGS